MKPRTFRREPDADLTPYTPGEIACLSDLAKGRLWRFPKGYALRGIDGEPAGKVHNARIVFSLLDKGIVRAWAIVGTGSNDRYVESAGGEAAWIVRTAARRR